MFRPNQSCVINSASGQTDVHGMPISGVSKKEQCAIVKLILESEKTAPRANNSDTRGNAREMETNTVLLLAKNTVAKIDDTIDVLGSNFRIMSMFPRCDILGALDHYEITCSYWAGQ